MRVFLDIDEWMDAIENIHQKEQAKLKCVNCPDDWKEELRADGEEDEQQEIEEEEE